MPHSTSETVKAAWAPGLGPLTRRRFLLLCLGMGVFITVLSGLAHRHRRALYRRYLQLKLDESSPTGILSPEAFRTVKALFETIAPRPAPPTHELHDFVDWRTSTVAGYYAEYQRAAALLESTAQARYRAGFVLLAAPARDDVLRGLLPRHTFLPLQEGLAYHHIEPGLIGKIRVAGELLLFNARARLKYFVFWDLLTLYWMSSAGWGAVGYSSYPGVPDPQRTYAASLRRARAGSPEPLSLVHAVVRPSLIPDETRV